MERSGPRHTVPVAADGHCKNCGLYGLHRPRLSNGCRPLILAVMNVRRMSIICDVRSVPPSTPLVCRTGSRTAIEFRQQLTKRILLMLFLVHITTHWKKIHGGSHLAAVLQAVCLLTAAAVTGPGCASSRQQVEKTVYNNTRDVDHITRHIDQPCPPVRSI